MRKFLGSVFGLFTVLCLVLLVITFSTGTATAAQPTHTPPPPTATPALFWYFKINGNGSCMENQFKKDQQPEGWTLGRCPPNTATATAVPTATNVPPTPTNTPILCLDPFASNFLGLGECIYPTSTPVPPTDTPIPPTDTQVPTIAPTDTPQVGDTPTDVPPTDTPFIQDTPTGEIQPTATPVVDTPTDIAPTDTPAADTPTPGTGCEGDCPTPTSEIQPTPTPGAGVSASVDNPGKGRCPDAYDKGDLKYINRNVKGLPRCWNGRNFNTIRNGHGTLVNP